MLQNLKQNKTVNYVVGGIAIASIALLAYTVTRPTKETKKSKNKSKRNKNKEKSKKFDYTFNKKPIDINLVMETLDGFNAHVAGDKKNAKLHLKYGARLIKINDKRVENLPYEEIFELLQKTKCPIKLVFRQLTDLNEQWSKAEKLKEDANSDFKEGNIESAIEKVSAAIQLHPTNKIYYSNRILMYFKLNQNELALQDCQIIRELDPKSVYIKGHYLRGLTLMNLKKYKNAASAFQTVVKLNPSFKKATDRLNECLKQLENELTKTEKRRSSEQQFLKEQFLAKKKDDVDADGNDDEKEQGKGEEKEKDKEDESEKVPDAAPQSIFESNDNNNNNDIKPEETAKTENVNVNNKSEGECQSDNKEEPKLEPKQEPKEEEPVKEEPKEAPKEKVKVEEAPEEPPKDEIPAESKPAAVSSD